MRERSLSDFRKLESRHAANPMLGVAPARIYQAALVAAPAPSYSIA